MEKFPFSYEFVKNNKNKFLEFLRYQANVEWGGYRIFDGTYNHLQQIPEEQADFILYLINHEKKVDHKIEKFLEIGFSSGLNNTILDKIFHFKEIVAIDSFQWRVNSDSLYANLKFKNLILICSESTSKRSINLAKKLGPYDLIFIDGDHSYEVVKKDFENYKTLINDNGVIALHDINSIIHTGVPKLWEEIIKSKVYKTTTVICTDFPMKAGIGILKKK